MFVGIGFMVLLFVVEFSFFGGFEYDVVKVVIFFVLVFVVVGVLVLLGVWNCWYWVIVV